MTCRALLFLCLSLVSLSLGGISACAGDDDADTGSPRDLSAEVVADVAAGDAVAPDLDQPGLDLLDLNDAVPADLAPADLTELHDTDGDTTAAADLTDATGDVPVTYRYAVKVMNMPMAAVLDALPSFAARDLTLYLNVMPTHIGDAELGAVLERAKDLGVRVRLWPLLAPEDGAWCNEDNLELFWSNVFDAIDYIDTLDHTIELIVINSELGPPGIDRIREAFADGNWEALIEIVKANTDRAQFERSVAFTQAQVDELHARGFLAQITTYPYLLDDLADGDPDIQDAANVVLQGVDWDRLAFTPYTAAYTADFGRVFGPYFVYSYARMARERFGDKVDIALGLIAPCATRGYASPADLAADVAAAKAAGVDHIDVFDLRGMLADDRFDEWADALLVPPLQPPVEESTEQFHRQFAFADQILDALTSDRAAP